MKLVAAKQKVEPDNRVGSASAFGSGGQWYEPQRGAMFFHLPVVQKQFFRH